MAKCKLIGLLTLKQRMRMSGSEKEIIVSILLGSPLEGRKNNSTL